MVSVVIPAYNEEKALPATLSALFMQQGDSEVIVVDGGSIDRTIERVQEFTLSTQHCDLFDSSPLRRAAPPR